MRSARIVAMAGAALVLLGGCSWFADDGRTVEVNATVEGDPVTVSQQGLDGALLCAEGDGGGFCTSANAEVPSIGVTESADGGVRIALLNPKQVPLDLVLTVGQDRTSVPVAGGAASFVISLESMPDLVQAVTSTGEVVAEYDGARLQQIRLDAEAADQD